MIKNILLTTALFASIGAAAQTSSYQDRARLYIQQYKDLAQEEQRRSGVPAAITLGQGILETDAGRSELATLANNHFGIKCKKSWTGETFAHDDDAPQECFRKYPTALQSYSDHSDYLKTSKRYESCFAQVPTDYASWAKELRKCGYATNPRYSQMLIKIIEDFHLQDHTYAAMTATERPVLIASAASPAATAMMTTKGIPGEVVPEHDTPAISEDKPEYGKVVNKDGTRGFYARKGDVLLEYAIRYKVRYARLLEINGLPDAPLAADMFVSLEKGNRIVRIISRDASTPPPAATYEAPANKEVIRREEPVLANNREVPAEKAGTTNKTDNDLSDGKTLQPDDHGNPVGQMASPVAIPEKTPEIPDAKHISTATQKPAATTTAAELPIQKPAPPSEKPINIADEVAVEEIKEVVKPKAPEEPLDEFSRLKARLDKVVYAPAKTPAPKPAATQVAASPTIEKPVVSATPAVATAAGGKMYHTVKSGETAFGIARQYGISMKELMTMNDLNFQAIKIGQKLRVR